MTRRPAGAEAHERREKSLLVYDTVTRYLHQRRAGSLPPDSPQTRMYFVALSEYYRTKPHPVLGEVNPDEVIGLRSPSYRLAVLWAKHWLGMRGFPKVLDHSAFLAAGDSYPGGCPKFWEVPVSRHYVRPDGSRIVVWVDGSVDAYDPEGRRKQTTATADNLQVGQGLWRETFFDIDDRELAIEEIIKICKSAGVVL